MAEPGEHGKKTLEGRIALVTGGSKGIGKGAAIALARAGADVAVNYRTDRGSTETTVATVQSMGVRALAVEADVTDRAAVNAMYDQVEKELGTVQIVVANAGSSVRRSVLETTGEGLQKTLDVIVFGCFNTMQEGAKRMIAAGLPGRMVTVGSVHAWIPFANALAYNVAKAALHHLTKSFAAELLPHGIHANVIVPGLTDTLGERNFRTEEELAEAAKSLPMGRMGTADEVGNLIRFLVSPENDYMTGSVITADGGIGVNLSVGLRSQPGGS